MTEQVKKEVTLCDGIGFGIVAACDHAIGLELYCNDVTVAALLIPHDQVEEMATSLIAAAKQAAGMAAEVAEALALAQAQATIEA